MSKSEFRAELITVLRRIAAALERAVTVEEIKREHRGD